jgi:ParB family chromosome partitioning protein
MRLAQTHVWPLLRYLEMMAPAAAASSSASSNTMKGALPAELEAELLDLVGALAHQHAADLGRACKRDLAHRRVRGELAADGARVAGDHVEDALGHAGADRELGERERRVRRLARGLQHHGAARSRARGRPCA